MRNPRGPLVLFVAAIVAGILLAAMLAAAGTVTEWAAEALTAAGLVALALVAIAAVWLTWLDVVRSRTASEYGWTVARTVLAAACGIGMWHALAGAADAGLYLVCLFGALIALALMFLFALAKAPDTSVTSSATRQAPAEPTGARLS
jgi:hypothetical protein